MLKIEYVPLKSIKKYSGNVKIHNKKQVSEIAESIRQFGFNDPIALWNGEIVEGHGRYEAAKKLEMKEVPVIRLDELTDEQRKAYTLVHNQLNLSTGFDMDKLREELDSISDIDMSMFDFDSFSIDDIEEMHPRVTDEKHSETYEKTFVFPYAAKEKVSKYLNKHQADIIKQIIEEADKDD